MSLFSFMSILLCSFLCFCLVRFWIQNCAKNAFKPFYFSALLNGASRAVFLLEWTWREKRGVQPCLWLDAIDAATRTPTCVFSLFVAVCTCTCTVCVLCWLSCNYTDGLARQYNLYTHKLLANDIRHGNQFYVG